MWTGVPVRVVAEALGGVVPGAGFLAGTGGEKLPEGLDPMSISVERSVPAIAMTDALLAWEMNGVPIGQPRHRHSGQRTSSTAPGESRRLQHELV